MSENKDMEKNNIAENEVTEKNEAANEKGNASGNEAAEKNDITTEKSNAVGNTANEGFALNNKKKNKLLVGIIAVLLVVIACMTFLIVKESKNDDKDKKDTQTTFASHTDAVSEAVTEGGSDNIEDSDLKPDGSDGEIDNVQAAAGAVSCNMSNSWEGNGGYFGQFDFSINNTSASPIKNWTIKTAVAAGTKIDSNWNCSCEIQGEYLIITPADFNSEVAAAGKCSDIGVILSASSKADLDKPKAAPVLLVNGKEYSADNVSGNDDSTSNTTAAPTETTTVSATTEATTEEDNPVVQTKPETGTPVDNHGKLSVKGTDLVDKSGNKYQLKGVSTHGIAWFPQYLNKDAVKTIRDDWGANLIRIAMYSDENNGYCSGGNKDEQKKLVCSGVDAATELGMYVIIDWHVLGDGNPLVHKDEAKKFFDEMSKKYKNNSNVIYEICNEPNGGCQWSDIKKYANEIIPVIKANDPEAVIIVGTPTWSQDVDVAANDPITGYTNIMYAIHFYAATHTDGIRNKAIAAISAGIPIFVSEFSICDASGNGGIDYNQADEWFKLIDKYNLSYAGWSLCNKNETSALISSSCNKTSGWSESDLSETGKWLRNQIKND